MAATDDVSRYLVDGWIMVGAQCRSHIADRQAARAFPLIPFERFHKWDIVPTGSHVRGEIQLCVPASRLVNVDVRENVPNWFVSLDCRLVGSLLFHVLVVDGVMACVDDA